MYSLTNIHACDRLLKSSLSFNRDRCFTDLLFIFFKTCGVKDAPFPDSDAVLRYRRIGLGLLLPESDPGEVRFAPCIVQVHS